MKTDIFRRADELLPPDAILASNTSSIPITSLAAATQRPDRVIGMHFFNPVPVLQLVEVIRGRETSDETARRDRRARARPRQDAGPGERLPRLRLEPHPDAVHQRGRVRALRTASPSRRRSTRSRSSASPTRWGRSRSPTSSASTPASRSWKSSSTASATRSTRPCPLLRQYVQAGRLGRKSRARLLRVRVTRSGDSSGLPGLPKGNAGDMKILLVDDEPALRELLRVTFEGADVTVDEAGSAREAEAEIAADSPDLIVLDLRMPGDRRHRAVRAAQGGAGDARHPDRAAHGRRRSTRPAARRMPAPRRSCASRSARSSCSRSSSG